MFCDDRVMAVLENVLFPSDLNSFNEIIHTSSVIRLKSDKFNGIWSGEIPIVRLSSSYFFLFLSLPFCDPFTVLSTSPGLSMYISAFFSSVLHFLYTTCLWACGRCGFSYLVIDQLQFFRSKGKFVGITHNTALNEFHQDKKQHMQQVGRKRWDSVRSSEWVR